MQRTILLSSILVALAAAPSPTVNMKAETASAFDQYVRATESRMNDDIRDDHFLVVDPLPDQRRRAIYTQLQRGQIFIEPLRTRDDHQEIHIPGGLLHHWAGVIFIPKATLADVLAVLENYNNQDTYKPLVRRSKLIERDGERTNIFLQFFNNSSGKILLNAYFDVTDTKVGPTQYQVATRSTRIAEVADPDGPDDRELPVGHDHGYMWRLDTYWRLEEKDGGVYLQNESIALTRTVPFLLAWLVNPLVKSIPRNAIAFLLSATRKAVLGPADLPTQSEGLIYESAVTLR